MRLFAGCTWALPSWVERMKKQFSLLRTFRRGEFRHFLWITAASFLFLTVLGFLLGLLLPELSANAVEFFSMVVEQSGMAQEDGTLNVILLFFNNFRAMLTGILYGLIPFLFLPAVSLGLNAMLIGLFGSLFVRNGMGLLVYLAGILPHGIFEIPALVCSIACGIYLCRSITNYVKHNEKGIVKAAIGDCLRLFLIVITPLLIIAAFIECYVTPMVMALFL